MRGLFRFLLILPLFAAPVLAHAQEESLGEVIVRPPTEGGEGIERHDSVAFTSVITAAELADRRSNLSEVLDETGGVRTRRYGGLDDFATVSIRGSTSEQVAVYLDGILLNPGNGGGVNIAAIPTDQIERIEIYRGGAPASFGSSSIGGIVNIVTKKGSAEKRETRLTQSYGSFQTYEGTLLHSQRLGGFSYDVGYTFSRSAGDFSFQDNNGTPFNASDDRKTSRANNEFTRHNLLTKIEHQVGRGISLRLQNQFFREDRGIPGLATLTSDTADLSTTRSATSLEVTKHEILPGLNLTVTPFFQFAKDQFSDPEGEIGLGAQDNDNDTFSYGSTLTGTLLLGRHQRMSLLLQYRGEQFLPEDFSNPSTSARSIRNSGSASLEDEIVLLSDRLVINPSIRSEHLFSKLAGSTGSALHPVSGKLGVKYTPLSLVRLVTGKAGSLGSNGGENPDSPPPCPPIGATSLCPSREKLPSENLLTFKTNFARAYRIPNFTELFGDRGTLVGNSDLSPESGWNWDIGMGVSPVPSLRFEVSYFLNHVQELIQLLQTSQYTVQAANLSSARIQGIETVVSFAPFEYLDLGGNYTFQRAKDTSGLPGVSGKFLPGRPIHEFNVKATLHNRRGQLFTAINFLDDNFLDTQNILRADSRIFFNAGASVYFLKRFTATLEAKNLLNDRVSDVVGFPLPGRSYYGKLEVKI